LNRIPKKIAHHFEIDFTLIPLNPMTIQALYSAATGMNAMETKLDVISNNLANMETTAYKRDRANFEDLFYRHEKLPGSQDASGEYTPMGIAIGLGVRTQSIQSDYLQGAYKTTGNQLDIAIEGQGFLQVMNPADSTTLYTRAGNLSKNVNGNLVIGSANTGRLLEPPIQIPQDATGIVISADGQVSVQQPGNNQLQIVGQIQLATFVNQQGLMKMGENLYKETDASGPPTINNPGTSGTGSVQQSMLEASNVEPTTELIEMITTQRAFELNSKAIQTGDELLGVVANLKRM
jgi:flagellar basal-body rod protein FlgG